MTLTIFLYISLVAFIFFSVTKAISFARMPLATRWEIYPVPKEEGKGEYGGSYYEEVKWYEKPRKISISGEIKEMLKEMLFIKMLFANQRPLWWCSYALHLGIYLLGLWTVMIFIGAVTEVAGLQIVTESGVNSHGWAAFVYYATILSGVLGTIMVTVGSVMLFLRRIFIQSLKRYTTIQDYFNLVFIFAVTVTGLIAWSNDLAFNYGRAIMVSLLTFSPIEADAALTRHILLLGLLILYIPQTKMSHYIGKYFAFHKVLWGNDPNLPGSEIENKIRESAGFKPSVTWSACHWQPGEPKSKEH